MFKKILIANRGEIACRIIKTARKMGIKTVAVYSEADTNAAHVSMADEAVYIGPSPASKSYLDIKSIVDAVVASGADAVHPGYGFLSENRKFARAVEKEDAVFIGPSAAAIRDMGDKITAKTIADKAGVSTVPGFMGEIKDASDAAKVATKIGYPVMVKATAGGGGKGMRVVHSKKEMEQAYSSAVNEAVNSFKDGRIFIEKFIEKPRHIEIQVVADKFGNAVCVGERECSIQRHHQKVIEEAPSSFIDEKTRATMYKQCLSLVKKVKYFSAGTVEFIVDEKKNFYFLEMNTRLQVEHPVTEYISGLDLVELMIKIAAGEKLPFEQKDIKLKGWAIESRIYAEDPTRGFLPSSGRISEYREPETSHDVRVDSGVYEGGQVSMFYDAMVAKLITYGDDRKSALEKMQSSLGEFVIRGVSHNISFLEAVMAHPRFASGDITTNFIEEEYPDGFFGAEITSETTKVFLSTAAHIFLEDAYRAGTITGQMVGRQRQIANRWVVSIDNDDFNISVKKLEGGGHEVKHEGNSIEMRTNWILGNRLLHGTVNERPVFVQIENVAGGYMLTHAGSNAMVKVRTPRVAELDKFMPDLQDNASALVICAPISGMIVDIKVSEGQDVKAGQELFILEAMKMENIICAEKDCKISAVNLKKGDVTSYGQVVIELE